MKSDSPINVRSSEEFAKGIFKPHGRVQMWVEGSVVYALAQGPFNQEFVTATVQARTELFKAGPPPQPHGHILTIHRSLMASPEMLTVFASFIAGLKHQSAATAWVVSQEVEGRDFLLPMFERIFLSNGRNFKSFETLVEAEDWVRPFLKIA